MTSISFWNCRGARKSKASLCPREFIRDHGEFFLGLIETKLTIIDSKLIKVMFVEGWDFFYVPSKGLSGGILLIWKQGMASYKVVEASTQFVVGDLDVLNKGTWRVATIYGSKDVYKRRLLWDGIDHLMVKDIPMIIGGDFNCLLSKEEKKGGRKFFFSMGTKEMKSFISCNDLHEVSCVGPKFTWCNNKKGAERILEKLMERHLGRIASDHSPILLNLLNFSSSARKVIRFKEVWTSILSSTAIVRESWRRKAQGDPAQVLNQKMKRTLRNLHYWSKAKFKELSVSKEELKEDIMGLKEKEADVGELLEEDQWNMKAKTEELNTVLAGSIQHGDNVLRLSGWWMGMQIPDSSKLLQVLGVI
ncbi:uncharacterized protein LOC110092031 [Dendrobium catenatum]|uniref:uncharacterized protein LOC110092031 n=1 Tax=Dendrobium catenatum TaxID=906689 RepID=UPI0009F540C0|nr:uncharacterized protein LOC110092031 [Dendrobium catenatum]